MNKSIYICAAATLMMGSCSNDEVVERAKENAISFRSAVGVNTRALNMVQDSLQRNGMYVTTFNKNGDLVYPETHYELDGGVWMAKPEQSWGGYSELDFYLAYPALSEWQTGFNLKDGKTVIVTVDEDIPQQKDYVMAHVLASKTNGAVSVSLKHVLSSVEIRATNTNSAYKYMVKGIRLNGVNKQAILDLSNLTVSWGIITNTSARSYELRYNTPVELDGTAKSIMGEAKNAILPPQAPNDGILIETWDGTSAIVTPDKAYISVLINLTATAGANIYPAGSGSTDDTRTYGWVAVPVEFRWESGKKYVYTLDFSEGAGRVDPYDPGTDVNPGVTDPDKAKPILGGLIRFGVTVTEWGNEDKDVDLKDGDKFGNITVDGWTDEKNDATVN